MQTQPGAARTSVRITTASRFDTVAEGHTDDTGAFTLTPSGTPATTDNFRLAIFLEDHAGTIVKVTTDGTAGWSVPYPATGYLTTARQALGTIAVPRIVFRDGNSEDAAKIYESIVRGKLWYDALGGFPTLARVAAVYPDPAGADTAYYQPDEVRIYLGIHSGRHASTILHEYGHHVSLAARSDHWRPAGLTHQMESQSTALHDWNLNEFPHYEDVVDPSVPSSASDVPNFVRTVRSQMETDFTEGYATFFGQNVLGTASYSDAFGTFSLESQRSCGCSAATRNTAREDNARVAGGNPYGDGPAAAYLWDLTDSGGDGGQDSVHRTFTEVHRLYLQHLPKRLPDFHPHLKTAFGVAAVDRLAQINHLTRMMRYTQSWLDSPAAFPR